MDEIYKDYYYKGTKTNYMISNKGNVYSKNIKRNLKLTPNTRGYLRVAIHIPGERTHVVSVHSMVIETFKGPKPSPEYQIDHIDGDKSNNYVENLEWVTASENILRAFKNGLKEGVKGSDHPVSVYTDEQIHKACKLLEQGMTIPNVAKEVGIPKSYLYNIARGDNWAHIVNLYDLSDINKITKTPEEIKKEISRMMIKGIKKSEIIKYINKKYNGNYKNIVYNYGRY